LSHNERIVGKQDRAESQSRADPGHRDNSFDEYFSGAFG
jgi:hypothetical protein